jgi:hypothetical protein
MKTPIIAAAALALSLVGLHTFITAEGVANAESTANPPAQQLVMPAQQLGCADAVLCVGDCKAGDVSCGAPLSSAGVVRSGARLQG